MDFTETRIFSIISNDLNSVQKLLVIDFCGESQCKPLNERENQLFEVVLRKSEKTGLGPAQFNELLLLLEQPRVSNDFFEYFFGRQLIKFDGIKRGIVKFRGFAMLVFGNIRYAFKTLNGMDVSEIKEYCSPFSRDSKDILNEFRRRYQKALEIERIDREKTWYLGYITKSKYENEAAYLKRIMKEEISAPNLSDSDIEILKDIYGELGPDIKHIESIGFKNTDVYLTLDYLDVYVATSMRNKWEFEETFDFISSVFSNKQLNKLKLRYFDPTQSQCENRIDKGLLEGLMLKRAVCTIYMAQETDTMGKDSELAATLAQGKPVLAYVPKIDTKKYQKKIANYPLEYFEKRLLLLTAEAILRDRECKRDLRRQNLDYKGVIQQFLDAYQEYRDTQFFSLWKAKEDEFKKDFNHFPSLCQIVSICEHHYFEKRAEVLRKRHPLSIQVYLDTGVANGVLVVRESDECSRLLYNLITNSLEFDIRLDTEGSGATFLTESISESPFRVVTNNTKLTNSFWVNYFSD